MWLSDRYAVVLYAMAGCDSRAVYAVSMQYPVPKLIHMVRGAILSNCHKILQPSGRERNSMHTSPDSMHTSPERMHESLEWSRLRAEEGTSM